MTKTAILRELQDKINEARLKKGTALMKVKDEQDKMKAREMFLYIENLDTYINALRRLKKFLQTEADLSLSRIFVLLETQEELEKTEAQYDGFYVTFSQEHITPYTTVDLFEKFNWENGKTTYEYCVQIEPVPILLEN